MRRGARWYSMEMAAMVTHIGIFKEIILIAKVQMLSQTPDY
jgi:hypothetical protein